MVSFQVADTSLVSRCPDVFFPTTDLPGETPCSAVLICIQTPKFPRILRLTWYCSVVINHASPHLALLLSWMLHKSGDQEWWLSRIWKDADRTTQSLSPTEVVPKSSKQAYGEKIVWGVACPDRDKIQQECASRLSFPQHRCRLRICSPCIRKGLNSSKQ